MARKIARGCRNGSSRSLWLRLVSRARQYLAMRVLDLISELIGHDGEDAQELARATVAATRSNKFVPEDEQPVALGGAIGTAPQSVDRSRPLRLAWHGGRPPFRVEVAATSGSEPYRDLTSNATRRGARPGGRAARNLSPDHQRG